MTKGRLFLFSVLVFALGIAGAQTLPTAPNRTNSKGEKEGRWIRYYNKSNGIAKEGDSIAYYDDVIFKAGKPTGLYRNYYASGVLESMGKLLDEDNWITDSVWNYYYPDGQHNTVEVYTDQFFDGDRTADQMTQLSDQIKSKYGIGHKYFLRTITRTNNYASAWHADEKGEIYLKRTLAEAIKLNPACETCYCALSNLGQFYFYKGADDQAKVYLEDAIKLAGRYVGSECKEQNPVIIMAVLLLDNFQYPRSRDLFEKGLAMIENHYGRNSREMRISLQWYFWYYNNQGMQKEAGEIAHEIWNGELKYTGSEEKIHGWIQFAMAKYYKDTGKYDEAEKIYRVIGTPDGRPDQLMFFLADQKRYAEAYPLMVREIDRKVRFMLSAFQFHSEHQREGYYNRMFSERANSFLTLLSGYMKERPACAEDMYNFHLINKAILLNSSAKWKQRIKQSGDVKLINLYAEWERVNSTLSNSESQDSPAILQLKRKNEELEKLLTKRSHLFVRSEERKTYKWTDVRDKLKHDEAAVEIVRYRKRAPVYYYNNGTKNIPQFKISDTTQYALLVVRPGDKMPSFTLLENGIDLEGKFYKYYMNCIRAGTEDKLSWKMYWEPVRKLCRGAKKIYISTDGIYNKINLNTLLNVGTGKFVIEESQLVQVTSTRDLLVTQPDEEVNKYALLMGSPDYSRQRLEDLPGSKEELERVSVILKQHAWTVDTFLGENALEENIKDSFKPGILHIAAHGFFYDKDSSGHTTVDVLNRAGLVLSSKVDTVMSRANEDGILTAYESMNLNLDDTDLVVLSACETAAGELKNSEGVYGLQRAFRVAGARTLIMSLWKVDDEMTRELMIEFYSQWLGGKDKVSSFRAAQLSMLKKTRDPMLWGGFVMLGM